jgi:hypothetical protein
MVQFFNYYANVFEKINMLINFSKVCDKNHGNGLKWMYKYQRTCVYLLRLVA